MAVGFWAKGTPLAFLLHGEMTWTGRNGAWTGEGAIQPSPQDQPYLCLVPGPDAREVRHWVSGVFASMSTIKQRRISGTCWERFLGIALPIPLLALLFIVLKNGFTGTWETALILGVIVLLVWVFDCAPVNRWDPIDLSDGAALQIGTERIAPSAIKKITPLRRYRSGITQLIEITFDVGADTRSAIVLSKPDLVPFGLLFTRPRTLRILLRNHPELHQRVQTERTI